VSSQVRRTTIYPARIDCTVDETSLVAGGFCHTPTRQSVAIDRIPARSGILIGVVVLPIEVGVWRVDHGLKSLSFKEMDQESVRWTPSVGQYWSNVK
jgi:hypothetical protein